MGRMPDHQERTPWPHRPVVGEGGLMGWVVNGVLIVFSAWAISAMMGTGFWMTFAFVVCLLAVFIVLKVLIEVVIIRVKEL